MAHLDANRHPAPDEKPPPEGWRLLARAAALRGLRTLFIVGQNTGAAALLALGGFVPIGARWLADDITGWSDIVEHFGGVTLGTTTNHPDADLGPVLGRADAPRLFDLLNDVARRLGTRAPGQVRLAYLPCCGLVTWGPRGRHHALLIGLPLLPVVSVGELRAMLAHELAHQSWGDSARLDRMARFVDELGRALQQQEHPDRQRRAPLRRWARWCHGLAARLIEPVALGQEARADRSAARVAGGPAAASSLVKVAVIQPLFREALAHYDHAGFDGTLYAYFRDFWARLPEPLRVSLRHSLLAAPSARHAVDATHPALLDRLAIVQAYPPRATRDDDDAPASSLLSDLEALEAMMHSRLFGGPPVERSTFHRAGS